MVQKKQLKAIDFFCCAGGVTSGFKKAGIKVLGGIDIESDYKKTYEKNNKGSIFIEADIAKLEPEKLATLLKIKPNMNDLIFIGCSPCQYYTTIQTDKTKSSKGKLLLEEFKRFVDYFMPAFIFIENVPGLETKAESPLSKFKNYLKRQGYIFEDKVVNASNYNVPQNRKRYVLIASRVVSEIEIPIVKAKTVKTVRDTIGNLPPISAGHKDEKADKHWSGRLEEINLERIRKVPHNGGSRISWKDDEKLQLSCYIGKDKTFSDVYGRLNWIYHHRPLPQNFIVFQMEDLDIQNRTGLYLLEKVLFCNPFLQRINFIRKTWVQ
jgi:DNA (cytosine-5)-methyltransferase 1